MACKHSVDKHAIKTTNRTPQFYKENTENRIVVNGSKYLWEIVYILVLIGQVFQLQNKPLHLKSARARVVVNSLLCMKLSDALMPDYSSQLRTFGGRGGGDM